MSDCILWTGKVNNAGYGYIGKFTRLAHREAYESVHGPIPVGLHVDHTCHNGSGCLLSKDCPHRRCMNTEHMETVTRQQNILRGEGLAAINARATHCAKGHPFDDANTYIVPTGKRKGKRECLVCRRTSALNFYHRTNYREKRRARLSYSDTSNQ